MISLYICALIFHTVYRLIRKNWAEGLFLDLFLLSTLNLLQFQSDKSSAFFFFAVPLTFLSLFLKYTANYYRISLLNFIHFSLYPKSFFDSIQTKTVLKILLFLLTSAIISIQLERLCEKSIDLLAISLIFSIILIFLKIKTLKQRMRSSSNAEYKFNFPSEFHSKIDPKTPLFRTTFKFTGERKFWMENKKNPHVIFVFLESFRAENVGCLGAKISASPNFDKWSEKGVLFKNFYSTGPQTFRAILSTLFGVIPNLSSPTLKDYKNKSLLGLPEIFKKNDYQNILIQASDLCFDHLESFFLSHSFDQLIGSESLSFKNKKTTSWGVDDAVCFDEAFEILSKSQKPTFMNIFTIGNHHPWKAPDNWNYPTPDGLSPNLKNFLQTFSYTDHCLGQFLQKLENNNLLENSLVWVFADHGQLLDEKGSFNECSLDIFQQNIHIPSLLLGSGLTTQNKQISEIASQVDILPTILDLLNLQENHHSMGRSLARNAHSPIYFSSPGIDPKLGWIEKTDKTIFFNNSIQTFDLKNDPQEQFPNKLPLEKKHLHHIQKLHTLELLWQNDSLCPKDSKIQATINLTDDLKPQEITSLLENHLCIDLDISKATQFRDLYFLNLSPEKAKLWKSLDLSNSLITDKTLFWISRNCKSLSKINLSFCHLITEKGLKKILFEHSMIQILEIENLDLKLKNKAPKKFWNFFSLNIKNSPNISSSWILSFYQNSPSLKEIKLCLSNLKDFDFQKLSECETRPSYIHLYNGNQISQNTLQRFLNHHKDLIELQLENWPNLETINLSHMTQLKHLKLVNIPNLKLESLVSLINPNLKLFEIYDCPKISKMKILDQNRPKNLLLQIF